MAQPPITHPVVDAKTGMITRPWSEYFLKSAQQSELAGYMLKSVYDPNGNGSVVDSDALGGESGSYYLDLWNATGVLRVAKTEWNVRPATVSTTAAVGDHIECDATSGAISVTLPNPINCIGKMVSVSKVDSSGNAVTVVGTVNGAVDPSTTTQYTVYWLLSVGAEWRRI